MTPSLCPCDQYPGKGALRRTCRRNRVGRGSARGTRFLAGGLGMTPVPWHSTPNDTRFRSMHSAGLNSIGVWQILCSSVAAGRRKGNMKDYEPILSFGEADAATYDDSLRGDEEATVAFLAQLARGGPALELAIGTGRIALPLAARGVRVDGIDFSPAMVAKLRAKPGGDQVAVT